VAGKGGWVMNDFTKIELEVIVNCIWCTISEYNDDKEKKMEAFAKKIEDMIANYCEHDWENPCCGCPNSASICTKCERRL
jgi:hypothetical protein